MTNQSHCKSAILAPQTKPDKVGKEREQPQPVIEGEHDSGVVPAAPTPPSLLLSNLSSFLLSH
jgi:hypothetical protein